MFDKGGIPMYPAMVLAALTFLTWAAAIVASYMDDKPADLDRPAVKRERKVA
ncbi:MAG: hypothetical protein AB7G68_11190 [Nitrospiraceae bacterium]